MTARTRTVPMRRCVVCRQEAAKRSLLRLVIGANGVTVDTQQRLPGRGTSLCPSCASFASESATPAQQKNLRRALARAFGNHSESAWVAIRGTQASPRAPQPAAASGVVVREGRHG